MLRLRLSLKWETVEDKVVRCTLLVLASVVCSLKCRNERPCFCVPFCFKFYCLYAARQECALSFSFAFSFLAFICVLRLCAFPLLIGSNIVLSWCVRHGFFLFCPLRIRYIYIYIYMLTRIRAASGLIISCIQPPGFVEVPFMVGMLCSIHSDIHVGIRSQVSAYELFFWLCYNNCDCCFEIL